MSDTHRRCKELLEQNGFSVSQPLVLCMRNAFDITTRQTIKRYYRLQQLELRFILQIEWCITHHIRAQYIETILQCIEAVSGFTNHFSSSFEDNELYFLSFRVRAKSGIAKDLIEADDIGRQAVADFIDSLLVKKLSYTTP